MSESTGELSEGDQPEQFSERRCALKAEFERVALPQRSHLYKVASYLTKKRARAEDLVQETYLRAFRYFDRYQPGSNCKAWLVSILRHLFINRYRHMKREPEMVDCECLDQMCAVAVEQEEIMERGDPENLLQENHLHEEVEEALNELPPDYRRAVSLVDIEELSYEEAAQVMACPIGTLRSRVSRGRRLLESRLRDYVTKEGLIRRTPSLVEESSHQG
ncbi:MAG: sigma-70 family RNA polymerase sigma factor [Deltaproteobacteria bacterium]|nr:sigma-70 family RNA polymerase sigma factor [Deltaproteobacteria bacterium]